MSKPHVQRCDECSEPATCLAIDREGVTGPFACDACRSKCDPSSVGWLYHRPAGGVTWGKVHHGWRVLLTLVGGSADVHGDDPPQLEALSVIEITDVNEWFPTDTWFAVGGEEANDVGCHSQSPRKAIEAWVDEHDCEVIETLEPGKLTREEAIESAAGQEREAVVMLATKVATVLRGVATKIKVDSLPLQAEAAEYAALTLETLVEAIRDLKHRESQS